jgi:predicted kinase
MRWTPSPALGKIARVASAAAARGDHSSSPPGALLLLCGRSFSGKSTVTGLLQRGFAADVISLDAINAERGLDGGQGIPLEEWGRTNEIAADRTEKALRAGVSVVVDDTASPRFLRDGWREIAERAGAPCALIYVDVEEAVIWQRVRANRADPSRPDVTDEVMQEHLASFEPPAGDERTLVLRGGALSGEELVRTVRLHLAGS